MDTNYNCNVIYFRTGEIEEEAVAHEGNKASRAIFLKNGLVFTTGFTKHSERQYSLRAPGHLDDPIVMVELDTSNGVMFPLYDPDANLIYLCGKVTTIFSQNDNVLDSKHQNLSKQCVSVSHHRATVWSVTLRSPPSPLSCTTSTLSKLLTPNEALG